MTEIVDVWRYREVLLNLVRRNLKVRYKNSLLGFMWSLLNPLLQIGVWWLVFGVIMPQKPEPNYMSLLLTGFLPWLFFSQTILDSAACVTQEMALVKKAYFPRSILPLSALLSNLVHLALALLVLVVVFAFMGISTKAYFWAGVWLVIPSTLLIAVFTYGISAMVAAWSVLYADVKFIVSNVLSLWFFLTPVLYGISGVLLKQPPVVTNWVEGLLRKGLPAIQVTYLCDPLAIGILGYRSACLLRGGNPLVKTAPVTGLSDEMRLEAAKTAAQATAHMQHLFNFSHYVFAAIGIALLTAIIGQLIFRRLAPSFAERG
jgi:lipopolysaccharide transport system permease protein